jgi:hypothetical protein
LHCTVAWNADEATFGALDQGLARRASQFVAGPYKTARESAARTLWAVEHDVSIAEMYAIWRTKPLPEQIAYINSWPEISAYTAAASEAARMSKVPSRFLLSVCAQADRAGNEDQAFGFATGLAKREGPDWLAVGDPRNALGRKFQRQPFLGSVVAYMDTAYAVTVKAYNIYFDQTPVVHQTQLQVRPGRDYRPMVRNSDLGTQRRVIVPRVRALQSEGDDLVESAA